MFKFLDILFLMFHTSLIVFNLFGWIWKKTRKLNLITLLITGFSWIGLGIFYGWGYCFLTDWHWSVLEKTGVHILSDSYVKYLISRLLGFDLSEISVNYITGIAYAMALVLSLYFNLRKNVKV